MRVKKRLIFPLLFLMVLFIFKVSITPIGMTELENIDVVNIETSVAMACFFLYFSFFNICLMRQKSLLKFLDWILNTLIFLLLFCIPEELPKLQ